MTTRNTIYGPITEVPADEWLGWRRGCYMFGAPMYGIEDVADLRGQLLGHLPINRKDDRLAGQDRLDAMSAKDAMTEGKPLADARTTDFAALLAWCDAYISEYEADMAAYADAEV